MRELKGECKSASVTCCEVTQSGSCVAEPPPRGPTDATQPWGGGKGPTEPHAVLQPPCPPKAALKREDCTVLPDAASKK